MLKVITETYGEPESYIELEEKFIQWKQRDEEDVWAYSDALTDIARELQVLRHVPSDLEQERLKERFVRNLRNKVFGLNMKRYLEEHPAIKFEELVKVAAKRAREEQAIQNFESDKLQKGHSAVVREVEAGGVASGAESKDSTLERLEALIFKTAESVRKLAAMQENRVPVLETTEPENLDSMYDTHMQCNRVNVGPFNRQIRGRWLRRGGWFGSSQRYSFQGQCFNCGQFGHMARQCRAPSSQCEDAKMNKLEEEQVSPPLAVGKRGAPIVVNRAVGANAVGVRLEVPTNRKVEEWKGLIGKTPTGTVKIAGINVQSLFDTGSEVSLMDEQYYNDYFQPRGVELLGFEGLTLKAANGGNIPYSGYILVDVSVGGETVAKCGILVTKTGHRERSNRVLIGMNILQECRKVFLEMYGFDYQKKLTQTQDCEALVHCLNVVEQKFRWNSKPWLGYGKVMWPTEIPANSKKVVQISVPEYCENGEYMVEPLRSHQGWLPAGLFLIPTFTKVQHSRGAVLMVNILDVPVKLHQFWRIGAVVKGEVCQCDVPIVKTCKVSIESVVSPEFNDVSGQVPSDLRPYQLDVNLEGVSPDDQKRLWNLLREYKDVFALSSDDFGCTDVIEHEIHLTTEAPIKQPFRRIPPNQVKEVREHVEKLLKDQVIEESCSAYASPIVLVRKKDQSLRMCIDYRRVNAVTHKDAFPLPRISESLDALAGACWFSTFDLASGYHQVKVRKQDRHKTAFCTPFGLYQFVRMPFGLTNAPSTFQRLMERIFGDEIFTTILVYLDDLLVFSSSVKDNLDRMEKVFSLLRKFGLKLKPSKCHLLQQEVKYLGYKISESGVETDPAKIRVVKDWPRPKTVKELRSFLGFASFYRRFVLGFAKIAMPLHALTGGHTTAGKTSILTRWKQQEEEAFQTLKDRLVNAPILKCADYAKPFVVETDASFQGLGAVLSQEYNGKLYPVAYASRGLRKSERNMSKYSSMKLELLALKWAVADQFKDYLIGSQFTVYTDNNPLSRLEKLKLGAVEQRWVADLAKFQFKVLYKPGRANANADGLSRKVDSVPVPSASSSEEVEALAVEVAESDVNEGEKVLSDCQSSLEGFHSFACLPGIKERELHLLQSQDPVIGKYILYLQGGIDGTQEAKRNQEFARLWRERKSCT